MTAQQDTAAKRTVIDGAATAHPTTLPLNRTATAASVPVKSLDKVGHKRL